MDKNDFEEKPDNYIDIPKLFYSDLTGAPLQKCISCECDLLVDGRKYLIEKAIKPYDGYNSFSTIFEYGICMACAENMKSMISTLSMQRINEYFLRNLDVFTRRRLISSVDNKNYSDWINSCMVKGMDVSEINECQIYAQCDGQNLVLGEFPYMVSGVALDEVVELLSPETLDDLDRFKNEVVDGPSEFQDLLQGGPKVFI